MKNLEQVNGDRSVFATRLVSLIAGFVPLGVVLVDRGGTVLAANQAARDIVAEEDGIRLAGDRLVIAGKRDGKRLQRMIEQVIEASATDEPRIETCNISRPSATRPYRMLVVGIDAAAGEDTGMDLACIFLSDDERSLYPERQWLESFFGLTPTEAELASLLAGGSTLEEVARELGICMPTARTHLIPALNELDSRGGFPRARDHDSPWRTEGGSSWLRRSGFGGTARRMI